MGTTVSLRTLARGQEISGGCNEAMGMQEHQNRFFQRLEHATVFLTGKTYLKGWGRGGRLKREERMIKMEISERKHHH